MIGKNASCESELEIGKEKKPKLVILHQCISLLFILLTFQDFIFGQLPLHYFRAHERTGLIGPEVSK